MECWSSIQNANLTHTQRSYQMRPISEADFPEYPDNRKRRGRRREDQEGYKDMIYTRIAQALFAFLVGIAIGGFW
jgi:hypothetical protein